MATDINQRIEQIKADGKKALEENRIEDALKLASELHVLTLLRDRGIKNGG